jgi:opacity protein-like surface antigen
LDIKAMAGFLYIHSPELKIEVVSSTNPGFLIIENDRAVSFAWDLGAGIRYNIRGNKYLCLQYDYIGASPYFKDQKTYLMVDGEETESSNSYRQDVRVMNITVGIGYILD